MAIAFNKHFQEGIAAADGVLRQVHAEDASLTIRAGGWSLKQVLGHLIDSALNNHQRFVRASLDGGYEGPGYEQNGWVDIHGYGEMSWPSLLANWRGQNELLCRVVERVPPERLTAICKIGTGAPVSLAFLIEDYVTHLHHHIEQIRTAAGVNGSSHAELFVGYSLQKLQQMREYVRDSLQSLSEEQLWHRSGENCNSVGNLVLHLCGNVRQWIGHGVAGQPDIRKRDAEFAAKGGPSRQEIAALFEQTLNDAAAVLAALPGDRLTERIRPQKEEVSVLEAIYQVVGHLQQHVGQIVFATKQMTGRDLALYKP